MDNFYETGIGKPKKLMVLENTLRSLGFLSGPADPIREMAGDLRLLADILDDPGRTPKAKGERFAAFINDYIAGQLRWEALFKKGGKRSE